MFNKLIKIASLIASVIVLFGCSTTASVPERLSLEIQEFQTRSFEIDKKTAFSSTISVFQDLGFIINSANYEIGFITADNIDMQIVTASFEELENSTKIRFNFKIRSKNDTNFFSNSSETNLSDERKIYTKFFDKVGEAIFIKSAYKQNKKISSFDIDVMDKPKLDLLKESITGHKASTVTEASNVSKISTFSDSINDSYTLAFSNDYYKTVSGDTIDKIIQKTIKDSPLKIELLREAFVLQNPLKLNLNSKEKVKVGMEIKVPRNDFIIPFALEKNEYSDTTMKENLSFKTNINDIKGKKIEDASERAYTKWKEDSRKWIRFP